MKQQIDRTDKKILLELDKDARQPISAIAKKLRISRDIVSYRISRLLKNKIINGFFTIVDISKLGYFATKFFIRLQNTNKETEKELLFYIKKNQNIIYSANYDGNYDLVISIKTRTIKELAEELNRFDEKFGQYIAERQQASIIDAEYTPRHYLSEKNQIPKQKQHFGSVAETITIDNTDEIILEELSEDCRISSVNIADKTEKSADAIYKRINILEKKGIIQGYNTIPNEEQYPCIHHKILIKLNPRNKGELAGYCRAYCRAQKNIWYFCTTLGAWDMEIDIDTESQQEFREIMKELKNRFSDIIEEYTTLTVFRTNKYNFYS